MKYDWNAIYLEAKEAGVKAGDACTPIGMRVVQHTNMLDDSSPIAQSWDIPDGVCGFASVVIKPGTCSFAKWLIKNKLGGAQYYGGVGFSISEHRQSLQRKEAHASAVCEILSKYGINCYVDSRMD